MLPRLLEVCRPHAVPIPTLHAARAVWEPALWRLRTPRLRLSRVRLLHSLAPAPDEPATILGRPETSAHSCSWTPANAPGPGDTRCRHYWARASRPCRAP